MEEPRRPTKLRREGIMVDGVAVLRDEGEMEWWYTSLSKGVYGGGEGEREKAVGGRGWAGKGEGGRSELVVRPFFHGRTMPQEAKINVTKGGAGRWGRESKSQSKKEERGSEKDWVSRRSLSSSENCGPRFPQAEGGMVLGFLP